MLLKSVSTKPRSSRITALAASSSFSFSLLVLHRFSWQTPWAKGPSTQPGVWLAAGVNFALLAPRERSPQEGKSKESLHQEYRKETCFAITGWEKQGLTPHLRCQILTIFILMDTLKQLLYLRYECKCYSSVRHALGHTKIFSLLMAWIGSITHSALVSSSCSIHRLLF